MSKHLVEVRIPTFRRPDLLARALRSLIDQDHPNWVAHVLDDCPDGSARQTASTVKEARIHYHQNNSDRGATPNLDRAFSPDPFSDNAQWATVLEDDNAFMPGFLSANLRAAKKTDSLVLQRNATFVHANEDDQITNQCHSTLEHLYGKSARWVSWKERLRISFTRPAIGNLGLFWKLHNQIDLTVGVLNIDAFTQEHLRALIYPESIWYEPEPLAWFTHFLSKAQPSGDATIRNRLVRRSQIALMSRLLDLADPFDLAAASANAKTSNREKQLRLAMAEAGHLPSLAHPTFIKHALFLLKGLALTLLQPDPLRDFKIPRS